MMNEYISLIEIEKKYGKGNSLSILIQLHLVGYRAKVEDKIAKYHKDDVESAYEYMKSIGCIDEDGK